MTALVRLPGFPRKSPWSWRGGRLYLTHQVRAPKGPEDANRLYSGAGIDVVLFGHSHIAFQETLGTVLFFNPGAAGKRRFKVVPSIGMLELGTGTLELGTLELTGDGVRGTILPL